MLKFNILQAPHIFQLMLDEKDTEGRGFNGGGDGSDWAHRFFLEKAKRNEAFELFNWRFRSTQCLI